VPQRVLCGNAFKQFLEKRGIIFEPQSNLLFTFTNLTANANNITYSLLESDNTNATTFATVTANITLSSQSSAVHAYHVDLRSRKRYLRLSVTPGTATTDAITFAAVGFLTRKEEVPGTTTAMADAAVIL
jgi:hypothetical protein